MAPEAATATPTLRALSARTALFALYALAFLATLATAKALFALMGAADYAEYTVLFSVSLLVRILWHNTGVSVFARFYPSARDGDGEAYLRLVLAFLALPAVLLPLAAAVLWLFPATQLGDLTLAPAALIAGLLLGLALGTNAILTELDNVAFNRRRAALAMTVPGLVLLLAALAAGHFGLSVTQLVFLAATVILLIDLAHLAAFLRFARPRLPQNTPPAPRALAHRIAAFALPLVLWTGPAILMRVADKWLATALLDLDMVALFGVLLLLSQSAFAALYAVLNRTYVPEIYAAADPARAHRTVGLITRLILATGLAATLVALLAGGPILALLSEPRFAPHGWLLAPMLAAAALYTAADCQLLHGHIRHTLRPYLPTKLLVPFLYLALAALLIPPLGITGLIAAYAAAALAYLALAARATRRLLRAP